MENKKLLFKNTLVGLFDIQGYSHFIKNTPMQEAIDKSKELYNFVNHIAPISMGTAKTQFWILSDTIIVAIDTDIATLSFGSAYLFLHACSALLHSSLMHYGVPLRGAIGSGYLFFDENSGKSEFGDSAFLLGDGLVDAASFEKDQNWLGAMITPRAVESLSKFFSNDDGKCLLDCKKINGIVEYGEIPMKKNRKLDGYYLLPFHRDKNWRNKLPRWFEDRDDKLLFSDRIYGEPQIR